MTLRNLGLGAVGFSSVVKSLEHSEKLAELDLGFNFPGERGIEALRNCMMELKSLASLSVHSCDLDENSFPRLAGSLGSLKRLNLSGNRLCGTALGDMVAGCQLRSLFIQGCECGPELGATLGRALQQNRTITELDIRGCDLGELGFIAFCECLCRDTKICRLKMGWVYTPTTTDFYESLRGLVSQNTGIKFLQLQDLRLKHERELAEVLQSNRTLSDLIISGCFLPSPNEEFLALVKWLNPGVRVASEPRSLYSVLGKKDSLSPIIAKSNFRKSQKMLTERDFRWKLGSDTAGGCSRGDSSFQRIS